MSAVTVGHVAAPPLPARLEEPARSILLEEAALLHDLARAVGGPFHAVLPQPFDAAVAAFEQTLGDAGVDGDVYFAKKANKASCLMRRCAELRIGVDVASVGELRDALGGGVAGDRIMVTGPAKSEDLHRLALQHGCLIAVDALDELERLRATAAGVRTARILLRCAPPPGEAVSRFGLGDAELGEALRRCRDAAATVRLEGFSFHLAGYGIAPRANLAATLLGWCREARALELQPVRISIGGGFTVDYVAAGDWAQLGSSLSVEHVHASRRFDGFYPYHSPVAGAAMLRAILEHAPVGEDAPLGELLRRSGVRLACEPGRALLDQAGFSVFTVQGVKSREYGIITVDGTSLSLSEQWFASEFLPDPLLLAQPGRELSDEPFAACVGGASCLESDMLTWRKVGFPFRPRPGDIVVYPNTAGYQMDSNESSFHELPLPPKVVMERSGGRTCWRFDAPSGGGAAR